MSRLFIFVDPQNDFTERGSLPAKMTEETFLRIFETALTKAIDPEKDLLVITGDLHPKDHSSFKDEGGPFPSHCVIDKYGSEFIYADSEFFRSIKNINFIYKGMEKDTDEFSAFPEDDSRVLKLNAIIEDFEKSVGKITDVYIMGFVLEYCVDCTLKDINRILLDSNFEGNKYYVSDGIFDLGPTDEERERIYNEWKELGWKEVILDSLA